jgi:hypothetical protein
VHVVFFSKYPMGLGKYSITSGLGFSGKVMAIRGSIH